MTITLGTGIVIVITAALFALRELSFQQAIRFVITFLFMLLFILLMMGRV